MLIHIDSADRASGDATNFTIDVSSIGHFTRGTASAIGIKQVLIPYTWYNIIEGKNNKFSVIFSNATTKFVYINGSARDGSPSASQLAANIAGQMNVNSSGQTFNVAVDTITAQLVITATVGSQTFAIDTSFDPLVYQVIGGIKSQVLYPSVTGVVRFQNVINLTPERYVFIKTNIPLKDGFDYDTFTKSASNTIMKVPVAGPGISQFGNILYEPSEIQMRRCGAVQNAITFGLYHDDNRPVDLHGLDWSFSLNYE